MVAGVKTAAAALTVCAQMLHLLFTSPLHPDEAKLAVLLRMLREQVAAATTRPGPTRAGPIRPDPARPATHTHMCVCVQCVGVW